MTRTVFRENLSISRSCPCYRQSCATRAPAAIIGNTILCIGRHFPSLSDITNIIATFALINLRLYCESRICFCPWFDIIIYIFERACMQFHVYLFYFHV